MINGEFQSEFLTFREDSMWICAWRRFDVVTQGRTQKEAHERMLRTLAAIMIEAASDGTLTAPNHLRVPSDALLRSWIVAAARGAAE
jgi:hypothetical protein